MKDYVPKVTLLLLIITLIISPSLSVTSVKANQIGYAAGTPSIDLLSPENKTYTNSSVPLTFSIQQPITWAGYSLNGQPNITLTGNTTLPTMPDGKHSLALYYNLLGNTQAVNTHFMVDTVPPTGSIALSGGGTTSKDNAVNLALTAYDATSGVEKMRFFNFIWNQWETYATSKAWIFPAGEGYQTVYVQFMDYAGLISPPYRLTIYVGASEPPNPSQEPEELPTFQEDTAQPTKQPAETQIPKPTVQVTSTPTDQANEQTSPEPTQASETFLQSTLTEAAAIIVSLGALAVASVYFVKRFHKPAAAI